MKSSRPGVRSVPITVRSLECDDWPVVAKLFGEKGACGGCWCMWWRVPRGGKTWDEAKGEKNRDAFRLLVETGQVHAVIARSADEPVGWCSFGPRRTFPRVGTVRALRREFSGDPWSIVCFYVPAGWRGKGVAAKLLAAATKVAFDRGAREIEGYPVVPSRPPAKIPAAFAWSGVPALFERAGYREMRRPGVSRPIFVKKRSR